MVRLPRTSQPLDCGHVTSAHAADLPPHTPYTHLVHMFDAVARFNVLLGGRYAVEREPGRPPPRPPPRQRPGIIAGMVALTLCWSCSGGTTDVSEDTVGREVFIGVYVDLRAASLSLGPTETGFDVRDSILAAHGVTGEDLLEFVDTHGARVEFMSEIWSEIEGLLSERLGQNLLDEENEEL